MDRKKKEQQRAWVSTHCIIGPLEGSVAGFQKIFEVHMAKKETNNVILEVPVCFLSYITLHKQFGCNFEAAVSQILDETLVLFHQKEMG